MISYEKAKQGKRLMKKLIAEGKLENAALIGLIYQTPLRTGDAVTLRKSDLDGRTVLKGIQQIRKTLYEPAWQSLSDHQTAAEPSELH